MNIGAGARYARVAAGVLALVLALGQLALASEALEGVVNINVASAEELTQLPGVGAVRARAIVALREDRGGFLAVEELADVDGIGAAMLAKLRPYIRLDGTTSTVR